MFLLQKRNNPSIRRMWSLQERQEVQILAKDPGIFLLRCRVALTVPIEQATRLFLCTAVYP